MKDAFWCAWHVQVMRTLSAMWREEKAAQAVGDSADSALQDLTAAFAEAVV
jgi:hypothetical protein